MSAAAKTATRSAAAITGLDHFVTAVRAAQADGLCGYPLTAVVRARLAELLRHPAFLAPEHREPWPDRYRQHLVYVAPDRSFSVVALVWNPGQATPVHDHVCWCVVGVLEGLERETRFHLLRDAATGDEWLEETGRSLYRPGHTCALAPPDEDIHQVENAGDGRAISIHVYGADIAALGTSINRRFDQPVRPAGRPGALVPWRRASDE